MRAPRARRGALGPHERPHGVRGEAPSEEVRRVRVWLRRMTLYAVTIFLGAFLLFQVQPIVARYILPWYGGSPAVWTTCMLFFQLLLLGGYLYAHLVGTRLDPRRQPMVHAGLLLLALTVLPITPDESWKPVDPTNPTWQIVTLLFVTVGLPYLVVATSSPLLQHWFSRTEPSRSPYRLFALSNAGSLLGLVTYPFLLEPLLPTGMQTRMWSATFGVYVLLCGVCAIRVFRGGTSTTAPAQVDAASDPVPTRDRVLCLLLAACGSLMLLATTSQMTQDVAVVPFLWVLPLGLYLITFIICFDHERWYDRRVWSPVLGLALAAVIYMFWSDDLTLVQQMIVYAVMVFAACMVCHGELVKLKPATAHLTSFYLIVAGGGALGGVFATLVAPAIFNGFWEYQIGLVSTGVLLALCSDLHRPAGRLSLVKDLVSAVGIGALVLYFVTSIRNDQDEMITATRNFYGLLRVYDTDISEEPPPMMLRSLYHGEILHGAQLLAERRREPLTYFGPDSGVWLAIEHHPRRETGTLASTGLRIGVVGLGTGTLAALGRPGDTVRFYEINPEVERLANDYFFFLQDARATTEVVLGDGRVSLERELREQGSQQFDVLVLDAFSGDAIPIHLLTLEATELYWQHLRDDGVLLAHISNQYLSLHPVVRAGAEAFDKRFVMIDTDPDDAEYYGSTWVAVTSNRALLDRLAEHTVDWPTEPPQTVRWTDDFSSLLGVLD